MRWSSGHWSRVRWVLGAVLLALALAACGSGDDDAIEAAGDPAAQSSTTPPPLLEVEAGIQSIDRAVDDLHLAITLSSVPTGGSPACEATVIDRSKVDDVGLEPPVRPKVLLARADGQPLEVSADGTWVGCEHAPLPTVVELANPHGGRSVLVEQHVYAIWIPVGDGTYRKCALPECDPQTGQSPDPSGCDHTLVDAVRLGDVPRGSPIDVRGCAGGFAVVDIDLGASACPPSDGERNPCAGERIDRTFWRIAGTGWQLMSYGSRDVAGCADAELPPEFPRDLCEALPPAVP